MTIRYPDLAALVLRIGFGSYMLLGHGLGKFQKLFISGAEIKFPTILGLSPTLCLTLTVIAEFFACLLIIIGYKTRLASLLVIITMLVAAFYIHAGDPFFMSGSKGGSREPAIIYLIGFVALYLLGSGKYSIDDKLDSVI